MIKLPRLALVCGLLASCTVGPNFHPPNPALPKAWIGSARMPTLLPDGTQPQSDPDPRWWRGFGDPTLSALVDRAIAGNIGLEEAVLRIEASRADEAAARAAGLPNVTASGSYTREQLGLKGVLEERHIDESLGAVPIANSSLQGVLQSITAPTDFFQTGFDASWELDLFGQVRRSVEAAGAQTQAQIESRNDALVSLEAEVANDYLRLRGAQAEDSINRETIALEQKVFDLTRDRLNQGLTSKLDVENAYSELTQTEAALPRSEQEIDQMLDQLNILVGQAPGTIDPSLTTGTLVLPSIPAIIPIGLPASLARRRPDIREAEARLHAATAEVGVSTADLFPDLSLAGSVGTRNTKAGYLTHWASLFYTIGPSVSLPIFEGGRLRAQLRMARIEEAEAALDYRQRVLTALGDVEGALASYRTDKQRDQEIAETTASGRRAFSLAEEAYVQGLTNFLQVLNAERTYANDRQQLIDADVTAATDLVSLYKALGGGWQITQVNEGADPLSRRSKEPFAPAGVF